MLGGGGGGGHLFFCFVYKYMCKIIAFFFLNTILPQEIQNNSSIFRSSQAIPSTGPTLIMQITRAYQRVPLLPLQFPICLQLCTHTAHTAASQL